MGNVLTMFNKTVTIGLSDMLFATFVSLLS